MKLKKPNLTWRTRKRLKTAAIVLGTVIALSVTLWLCWILWLGRFVVYTGDTVRLDFDWVTPGDYVVHTDHGVGKFAGLVRIPNGNTTQEVMKLLFRNDDVVFVYVNNSGEPKNVPWSYYSEISEGLSGGVNVVTGEPCEVSDATVVDPQSVLIVEYKR